ncbi:hypothetical protein LTR37_006787 [Vermiconidia calcicola]|uniref:Uncharacterized protein n=1 Tax=Vermiconidia calcicola TaxID=1690605 RepID=A0ACC3NHA0_9PEZI|nr:hypothetical protein LTR37_006787 [Vermiconidia calcicola]
MRGPAQVANAIPQPLEWLSSMGFNVPKKKQTQSAWAHTFTITNSYSSTATAAVNCSDTGTSIVPSMHAPSAPVLSKHAVLPAKTSVPLPPHSSNCSEWVGSTTMIVPSASYNYSTSVPSQTTRSVSLSSASPNCSDSVSTAKAVSSGHPVPPPVAPPIAPHPSSTTSGAAVPPLGTTSPPSQLGTLVGSHPAPIPTGGYTKSSSSSPASSASSSKSPVINAAAGPDKAVTGLLAFLAVAVASLHL